MGKRNRSVSSKSKHLFDSELLQAVNDKKHAEVCRLLESHGSNISPSCLDRAVLQAVDLGQKHILQLLINHVHDINLKNDSGNTALMLAAEHGYFDLVKILVRHGAAVNVKNKIGRTALMLAAEKSCCVTILQFLVNVTEDQLEVNLQDKFGKTALHIAAELCDLSALETLMSHKNLDLNVKDKEGNTAMDIAKVNGIGEEFCVLQECRESRILMSPFIPAVKKGNVKVLKSFLGDSVSSVDASDEHGLTALILALTPPSDGFINMEVLKLLVEAGADVNKMYREVQQTPLMCAAQAGNLEAVKLLVEHGANVNAQTITDGVTALMIAAHYGFVNIADHLIKSGAYIGIRNNIVQETALTMAIKRGNAEMTKLFLEGGAEINEDIFRLAAEHDLHRLFPPLIGSIASDCTIHELFYFGISKGRCDLVSYLIDNGAKVNGRINLDTLPLSAAANNNDMIKLLLARGALVNHRLGRGKFTALIEAVCQNNGKVVKTLIEAGADTTIECNGSTALMFALKSGKKARSAFISLLSAGVDVNYATHFRDCSGIPLHLAVELDNETLEPLIDYGADLNVQDEIGRTALMLACSKNPLTVLMLVERGADVNRVSVNGDTALLVAVRLRAREAIKHLLKGGADVNFANYRGETPLMKAAQCCTTDILDLLIKYGADTNACDKFGTSVLLNAVMHSIAVTDKVAMLLDNGADVNKASMQGFTPLIMAASKCKTNMLSLLVEHGANVNAKDDCGANALHHAAGLLEETDKVEFLIANGAHVNVLTMGGRSALMAAAIKCNVRALKALLANDANTSIREKEQTALTYLLSCFANNSMLHYNDTSRCFMCIELLLKAGAKPNFSLETAMFFHRLIVCNNQKLLMLLISCGIAPMQFPTSMLIGSTLFPDRFIDIASSSKCDFLSPLCTAIFSKNTELAEFFVRNWYLTKWDVELQGKSNIRVAHHAHTGTRLGAVFQEVMNQPWSLTVLSFVAVSTLAGTSESREKRVRGLPLPTILQEKLLFRNITDIPGSTEEMDESLNLGANHVGLDATD